MSTERRIKSSVIIVEYVPNSPTHKLEIIILNKVRYGNTLLKIPKIGAYKMVFRKFKTIIKNCYISVADLTLNSEGKLFFSYTRSEDIYLIIYWSLYIVIYIYILFIITESKISIRTLRLFLYVLIFLRICTKEKIRDEEFCGGKGPSQRY